MGCTRSPFVFLSLLETAFHDPFGIFSTCKSSLNFIWLQTDTSSFTFNMSCDTSEADITVQSVVATVQLGKAFRGYFLHDGLYSLIFA